MGSQATGICIIIVTFHAHRALYTYIYVCSVAKCSAVSQGFFFSVWISCVYIHRKPRRRVTRVHAVFDPLWRRITPLSSVGKYYSNRRPPRGDNIMFSFCYGGHFSLYIQSLNSLWAWKERIPHVFNPWRSYIFFLNHIRAASRERKQKKRKKKRT